MWSALENMAFRESLPIPLETGRSIHDILVRYQLSQGRYNLYFQGMRGLKPYLFKQFYCLDTNAFLRWQNEARFIDLPQTPGYIWPCEEWRGGLISPFKEGLQLDQWLETTQPSLQVRLRKAAQLIQRIACLHRSGIQHRNLSPANIWINDETLFISNFGTARCDKWDDFWVDSVLPVAVDTTYASPESLQGKTCDQSHDMYAFGSLLHLLLTGKPPFGRVKHLLRQVAPGSIKPTPSLSTNEVPTLIQKLATASLAIDPSDRPTAMEAARELSDYGETHCTKGKVGFPMNGSHKNKQKILVFIKDDERAVPLFDSAMQQAENEQSQFLFVGLIPDNLPSGHKERFMGRLYRKLGNGLMRCRQHRLSWSLRLFENTVPERTARNLIEQYWPDQIFLGQAMTKPLSSFSKIFLHSTNSETPKINLIR
ncbi:protein kinase [uncultured Pseudodesulfovibrio sp.]|uniref:protein kinase domain-containing protein n=1 Tax=uncultured Pseudodesulfovibrio sp. TaxID=2035858 RepID=UPI0029C62CC9|nr:protein kinase [uncultured Pseudodesulfovibrio sp.]